MTEVTAAATAATILNLDNIKITDVLDILFNCYFNVINYNKCFSMVDTSSFVAAESLQSCPTLCDPMDGSPPGSPVHGILQAIGIY